MKKAQSLLFLFCFVVAGMTVAADTQKADVLFDKGQYRQALQEYLKPELQNNPSVQTRIGWLYGYTRELRDDKRSVKWYQKAADQGYPPGQYSLAVAYEKGKGIAMDYSKAMYWYRKAADQDYPKAYTGIGGLYEDGLGVKVDYKEAANWYKKAVDQKQPGAMCNLAYMQTFGKGIAKDHAKAHQTLELCLKTSEKDECCLSRMADLYRYGWGVTQDHAKANEYQARAAALGSGLAMFSLGTAYDYGFGVEKNTATALQWYEKGAAAGDARAMYRLYEAYEYGRPGQPADKAKAKEWLAKAQPAMKEQNVTRNTVKDQLRLMLED